MRSLLLLTALVACKPAVESTPPVTEPAPRLPDTEPGGSAPPSPRVEAPPVALVGDVPIEWKAFRAIYDLKVLKYVERGREIPGTADRRYRKSIAERLVHHEQLRQEAKALGVTHDAEALAARTRQQQRGIRDWTLHLQRRGETEESLRAMFIAELLERAILDTRGELDVSDAEIREDYEKIRDNWKSSKPRVRASHIFLPDGPGARQRIKQIHRLATAKGADFAAIAKEHSTGPSADKGGDVGIFSADRMDAAFSTAAFKLAPGQISRPVQTKFGWHIIKLTGKWPPGDLPLAALRDQIVDRLRHRKLHQGRRTLADHLRITRPATWFIVLDPSRPVRPTHAIGRPTIEDGSALPEDEPLD